jgi:hypothetical protein
LNHFINDLTKDPVRLQLSNNFITPCSAKSGKVPCKSLKLPALCLPSFWEGGQKERVKTRKREEEFRLSEIG